ncbi:Cytochrome c-like protein [Candidatus Sulfopaludibacter sp. SbA4]|nr:Cytochrome c-like protein [Candidatus Sulfopaludibacter sp. SbA4]
MWKKIILIVVVVIVGVPAAGIVYLYLRKPAQAPASAIKVAMTPERIARGKLIFHNIADCDGCHSERDFSRVDGPVVESGRGRGNVMSALLIGMPGTVVAPNITPDPETGIGSWTDGEKIRAIREGVDRNGRALFPMMPYTDYRKMSDEDVESVVAYMNSLAPVKNPLPKTQLAFPVNLLIKGAPQPAASVPAPVRSDKLKYGEYLVTIAACGDCHTPVEKGQPIPGKLLAGGQVFATSMGTVVTANITPDLETGIGKWSEEFFLKKIYDYKEYATSGPPKSPGPEAFTLMPWLGLSQLPPDDLGAIYAYLRTVKPVHNPVETHPKNASAANHLP